MTSYQKDITSYFKDQATFNNLQRETQQKFERFAYDIDVIYNCPEKSVALRKLLESFDAAMRALSS